VGEVISSTASAVAITSNVSTNITSLSLTAGDWDVQGAIHSNPAGTTTQALMACGINTTSATLPTNYVVSPPLAAGTSGGVTTNDTRISISGTTTVYLIGYDVYAVSTLTMNGEIYARRAR
jgi:hypothetical protein